jgi:hypothetical protein
VIEMQEPFDVFNWLHLENCVSIAGKFI